MYDYSHTYIHVQQYYCDIFRSALMELRYFDICSGALVPDVLHDVLEGGLQYEAKLLLQHCIYNLPGIFLPG
jgi:hypothetical protein